MTFNIDTLGWNINFGQLHIPKEGVMAPYVDSSGNFFESTDKKYGCLFYGVTEYKMGCYGGVIGIFENKDNPTLIANPKNQWFHYGGKSTAVFSDNYLFLIKLAYNRNDIHLSGRPFVVFDLDKMKFGFVEFDWRSIYYSPLKIDETTYKFSLEYPQELRDRDPSREGEIFELTKIKFNSFDKLDKLIDIYFDEKKNNAC